MDKQESDMIFDTSGYDGAGFESPFPDEGIQLPFFAPVMFWKHGNPQAGVGIPQFGGWGAASEQFGFGNDAPRGWAPETWYSSSGGAYDVYAARTASIAPILTRTRWTTNESGKSRSHKQMLCLLATWDEVAYVPYGTVVLSTKGLASKYLMDALAEYDRQLNPLRLELAPHISAPFFWHAVGTFGEKPQYETMGSGNQTSTGTIIQAGSISKLDKDTLQALFVGVDVMNMMRDFQEQAKEWYDAWKETDNIRVVDEAPSVSEDIPF